MLRQLLPATVVLLALASGCTEPAANGNGPTGGPPSTTNGTTPPLIPPATNTATPKPPLPTVAAPADRRASALAGATRCGPPGTQISFADLTWQPAKSAGIQRVAYSPYADGYRTGRYELTPELAATATSVTLQQLSPGSTYTWLVLTRHGDSWDASETTQFTAPICVADQGTNG